MSDLLICIRSHTAPDLVRDTLESVRMYTDPATTKIMCAIDGNNVQMANELSRDFEDGVYVSGTRWGWGAGLYGLLTESIQWARQRYKFAHFMSIDYDTLFIAPGVDTDVLNLIDSVDVGLVGHYASTSVHWSTVFCRDTLLIQQKLGTIPDTYIPGEGVQGGLFCITHRMLKEMQHLGMFRPPWSIAKCFTRLADDHLIVLYARYCGLEVRSLPSSFHIRWQLEMDPLDMFDKGIKAFHPTKVKPGRSARAVESRVREYYRKVRHGEC